MTQNQLSILIIEDERTSADRLYRQIKRIEPNASVHGPLASVTESIEWFKNNNTAVDVILADIRLDDGLCFDALRYAPSTSAIVFTTAYDEYAIKAFKYNSIDYLLKPINPEELEDALVKAKKTVRNQDATVDALIALLDRSKGHYRERFLTPCSDGYKTVDVNDVDYIFTENKEVHLFLADGSSEMISYSMDELEKQLDPDRFFRANRQFIVSIGSISKLANSFGGKFKLILRNYPKVLIPISKEKAPMLKAWLDK